MVRGTNNLTSNNDMSGNTERKDTPHQKVRHLSLSTLFALSTFIINLPANTYFYESTSFRTYKQDL